MLLSFEPCTYAYADNTRREEIRHRCRVRSTAHIGRKRINLSLGFQPCTGATTRCNIITDGLAKIKKIKNGSPNAFASASSTFDLRADSVRADDVFGGGRTLFLPSGRLRYRRMKHARAVARSGPLDRGGLPVTSVLSADYCLLVAFSICIDQSRPSPPLVRPSERVAGEKMPNRARALLIVIDHGIRVQRYASYAGPVFSYF